MLKALLVLLIITFSFIVQAKVQAKEISGIVFEDSIQIPEVQAPLKLNGLGIRSKFFFDIYIAALYVQSKSTQADKIIADLGAKRIVMHFLYGEVSQEKLTDGWLSGFKKNLSPSEFSELKPDIEQFNRMFETSHAGDIMLFDYLPAQGCRVTIKGQEKGLITNPKFYPSLLKIWLGSNPISGRLKNELLIR